MPTEALFQKAARITERIRRYNAGKAAARTLHERVPGRRIVTVCEAVHRFFVENPREPEAPVLLIEGDVVVDGVLDGAWLDRQLSGLPRNRRPRGAIIAGDLAVGDAIVDDDALELAVLGNLACEYLHSERGRIEVRGHARVAHGIHGGRDGGFLRIRGRLDCPYLVAGDHDMPRSAAGDFIRIEAGDDDAREDVAIDDRRGGGRGWDGRHPAEPAACLPPAALDGNGRFSAERFFRIVRRGENPFAAGRQGRPALTLVA